MDSLSVAILEVLVRDARFLWISNDESAVRFLRRYLRPIIGLVASKVFPVLDQHGEFSGISDADRASFADAIGSVMQLLVCTQTVL